MTFLSPSSVPDSIVSHTFFTSRVIFIQIVQTA